MIAIMSGLIEALSALPNQTVSIAAGATLFCSGDAVRFLYVVRSGCIHLSRFDAQGRAAVMQRAVAGMALAESSIFSEVYHCDAVAILDTELLRVVRGDLRRAMQDQPDTMEAVARHLAQEVQLTRVRVEVLSKKSVRERLDAWLTLGGGRIPEYGSMASVAHDIGVTPEAFYREMSRRRMDVAEVGRRRSKDGAHSPRR